MQIHLVVHQSAFAAYALEHLWQQGAKQFLALDGRMANLTVDIVEAPGGDFGWVVLRHSRL